jgi:hypothetical protein
MVVERTRAAASQAPGPTAPGLRLCPRECGEQARDLLLGIRVDDPDPQGSVGQAEVRHYLDRVVVAVPDRESGGGEARRGLRGALPERDSANVGTRPFIVAGPWSLQPSGIPSSRIWPSRLSWRVMNSQPTSSRWSTAALKPQRR